MAVDTSALTALGFTEADTAEMQGIADFFGMSENGPYTLAGVFTNKNGVTAVVEQNTSPDTDESGEVETMVKHPPLVVMESRRGRVACKLSDVEAIKTCMEQLS